MYSTSRFSGTSSLSRSAACNAGANSLRSSAARMRRTSVSMRDGEGSISTACIGPSKKRRTFLPAFHFTAAHRIGGRLSRLFFGSKLITELDAGDSRPQHRLRVDELVGVRKRAGVLVRQVLHEELHVPSVLGKAGRRVKGRISRHSIVLDGSDRGVGGSVVLGAHLSEGLVFSYGELIARPHVALKQRGLAERAALQSIDVGNVGDGLAEIRAGGIVFV